jgi:hypothetical protein
MVTMSSNTIYGQILTEARNHNPEASPDEILNGLVTILENEILPEVLQDMRLPKFPSLSDMLHSESTGRLVKRKFEPTETLRKRRDVIQQIERTKRQLGWDGNNESKVLPYFSNSNDLAVFPELSVSSAERAKSYVEKPEIPIPEKIDEPYPKFFPPSKLPYQIVLSEAFQKRILSDPMFENIFKNIEISMRSLIASRGLEADISVISLTDFEIPSWEKLVININPLSSMDFKERMNVWTIFDITIRNKMADLAKDADEKTQEFLRNLNKRLYLHIEL